MIQAALDTGAFDTFMMGDGMYGDALVADLGGDMEGSFGAVPWSEGAGADAFKAITDEAGINGESSFTRESYDAAALIALAMMAGGEATSASVKDNLMAVANAPGEEILPGELGKALRDSQGWWRDRLCRRDQRGTDRTGRSRRLLSRLRDQGRRIHDRRLPLIPYS